MENKKKKNKKKNGKKRTACLYRVSTKKQVSGKDDIPMQRIACQEFAASKGWTIVKELTEKGVSGFKVSAEDRDAILELKEAALRDEFDVLLVFMFDRIGRREDETPFVVEWFAEHGIEIWSCTEGEQRFDDHNDKLINFIRYWIAGGESIKTSERIKTRIRQLALEGSYIGGVTRFGHKMVPTGKINKKGRMINELKVDEKEAEVIKMLFEKTKYEGMGSYQLAQMVNSMGIKTHNGALFTSLTVLRILGRRIYCGYVTVEDLVSPKIEELEIVDDDLFNDVQYILGQRSKKNDQKKHIAQTTKSKTMLSGNIICGHCGGNLVASNYYDKHERKDGTVVKVKKIRYICYHKSRHLNNCDGQSTFIAYKIDDAVTNILKEYLDRIKVTPKDRALEARFQNQLKSNKKMLCNLQEGLAKKKKRMDVLTDEIGKALVGESSFSPDVLSVAISKLKEEIQEDEGKIGQCEQEIDDKSQTIGQLDHHYEQFKSWSDEFDSASPERKKMIACQLIEEIKVFKGYKLEIKFNTTYEQFFEPISEPISLLAV